MTCRYCEFKFCWACRKGATYGHFSNPKLGCGVALFENPGENQCLRVLKTVGIVILCVLLFPLFLIFFLPVVMCVAVWKTLEEKPLGEKIISVVILFPIMFIFGLILNVIFIPIFIVILIVTAIIHCK